MTQPDKPSGPRIGDNEREQAVRALGEHYSHGRLDLPEFEERVTQAMQSRTAGELRPLYADLPWPHPPIAAPPQHPAPPCPGPPPPGSSMCPGPPMHPHTGNFAETSPKLKLAAGLLQISLPFGIGRFYTGHTNIAIGQLVAFLFGALLCGAGAIPAVVWCIVDGISILANDSTDARGRRLSS